MTKSSKAKPEPFLVPVGGTYKACRDKVKRPRIVSFRTEGNNLIAQLSCGHELVYCRIPKWTRCYKCPIETVHWDQPRHGYKRIPFTTEEVQ